MSGQIQNLRHPLSWCLVLCLGMTGCSGQTNRGESFESNMEPDSLPNGWELTSTSGTYRAALTGDARDGSVALAIAGTGGEADLLGKPILVPPGSALTCRVWVKPKAFSGGEGFVGAVGEFEAEDAWLTPVSTDTEDWCEYQFAGAAPLQESSTNLRFCLRLSGEGLISIDDFQYAVHEIDSRFQLADGNFELPQPGGALAEWRTASDTPGAQAIISSKSPLEGTQCLRLQGDGEWCVATWTSQISGSVTGIFLRGYARAVNGDAFIKIEYYRGTERLEDSVSTAVSSDSWQPLCVNSDPARLQRADRCLLTLVAKRAAKLGTLAVDFDQIQVLVVRP